MFLKFKISALILLSCFFVQAVPNQLHQTILNQRMYSAINMQNFEDLKRSLEEGADPKAKNMNGVGPLHDAWSEEARRVLIEAGADPNERGRNGQVILHRTGSEDEVYYLLRAGADPNVKDEWGNTPLHVARNAKIKTTLLAFGADPKAKDRYGKTPLHNVYDARVARILLVLGADPNAKDGSGVTPLHKARNAKIAQILLEAGADPNAKDKWGNTAADFNSSVEDGQALLDEREGNTGCEYTSDLTKIANSQCGRKLLCITEVSCSFYIGDFFMEDNYQAICPALANGDCPTADNCVLDRLVAEEANGQTDNGAAASSSSSSKPSKGVR